MRLSRSRKAVSSPNTAPKPRRRLFKTAKDSDSYLFKTAKAQREGEKMPPDMITQLKMAIGFSAGDASFNHVFSERVMDPTKGICTNQVEGM